MWNIVRLMEVDQETVPLPAFEIKLDPVGIGDLLDIARAAMEELLWCGRVQ